MFTAGRGRKWGSARIFSDSYARYVLSSDGGVTSMRVYPQLAD
jgi:hypothetical protein